MKSTQSTGPTICMKRDKEAVAFAIDHIKHAEPTATIGMTGIGKDVVYDELIKKAKNLLPSCKKKFLNATTKEELTALVTELEKDTHPTLCIVNLRIGEDVSWFVKEVQSIRQKRSISFIPVIIAYIGDVYASLEQLDKVLVTSLFPLVPVDKADAAILMADFEKRYEFHLTQKQRDDIYALSGGLVGLIKSLFLFCKAHPTAQLSSESLLEEASILYRVQSALQAFPQTKIKDLMTLRITHPERFLFEKFGYIVDGKIFSPLFQLFLQREKISSPTSLYRIFTTKELSIFQFLSSRIEDIVSREDIAKAIWQDEADEKYSDWAIDQLMHKLREKIKANNLPYEIITKKGEGFIFTPSSS